MRKVCGAGGINLVIDLIGVGACWQPFYIWPKSHLATQIQGCMNSQAAIDWGGVDQTVERRTAVQTAVHLITTGVMLALLAGIALKLKIFGGGP